MERNTHGHCSSQAHPPEIWGLAGMTGVDLQAEIEAKLAKNAAHIYQRQPDDALAASSGESG